MAQSLDIVDIQDVELVRSTNINTNSYTKDSSPFGTKYIVPKGVYVSYGSILPQLATKTGFTEEDAEKIKAALISLFENDASSARPAGSMTSTLYWWTHNCKCGKASSANVHQSLKITESDDFPYFRCQATEIEGIKTEVFSDLT